MGADRAAEIVASLWDLRDDRPVAEVMSGLQRT